MKNRLLIIGASGHGKVVADIAVRMNIWELIQFLDDDISITECMGFEVIGKPSEATNYINEADIFVAIGNNSTRERIQENLEAKGATVPALIHPNVTIGTYTEIGIGTVVMAGAVINSNTKIGRGCIINTSCSIDHDNVIGNFVHISPGVHTAGTVTVGKGSWVGIGSIVSNNVNICDGCKFGAGAVVVNNITESGTYVGVPARRL